MNESRVIKFLAIYLLISAALSFWYASGSIVSSAHYGTLLGNVCPASYSGSSIATQSADAHDDCPRLVQRILAMKSSSGTNESFMLLYGLVSGLFSLLILTYYGLRQKSDDAA